MRGPAQGPQAEQKGGRRVTNNDTGADTPSPASLPHQNVDYIGLDPSAQHLLFYASSPEALRDLKIPLSVVRRHGAINVASDLADAHLYVFNRWGAAVRALHACLQSGRWRAVARRCLLCCVLLDVGEHT